MKHRILWLSTLFLILYTAGIARLSAQNEDPALISDFKAFSFFNNEVIADSIHYSPEEPATGPVEYLQDTLDVFNSDGAFSLDYLPTDKTVYVGIWLDLNENGQFEKEEQLYSGSAQNGESGDVFVFPEFDGSRRLLVAISERQEDLADPLAIPKNERLSSLQFIIRAGPPTLTMGSKKDTRDTTENYCLEVPMELFLGPGHPCISVYKWIIEYPVSNSAQVNTNVTLNPSGLPFAVGTMLYANDYFTFDFDFSGFPVNDGETVNFIFQYAYCDDPAMIDSATFSFTKDCTTGVRNDPQNARNEALRLQLMPNPVRRQTQVKYELETAGPVQLAIFDLSGRQISILQNGHQAAGEHKLNYVPEELPAGLYWLHLRTQNGFLSRKMVIIDD